MIKTTRSFKSISLSLLSSVLLFTSAATPALAENWTLNGTNIYKNNSGNVGIGITTPTSLLHVSVATGAYGAIRVSEGSTPAIDIGDATGGGVNGIAALFSNGTEKIRLFADPTQNSWINAGNLGIGTSSPDSKLTVSGTTKLTGNPVSTPILTVDSNADGKYSAIVKGPNPGLAIQNINDPATTGLYKFVSSGNALLLYQNTAAAGDFSSQINTMTWKAGGDISVTNGNFKADKNAGTFTTASITSTGWKSDIISFPKTWSVAPKVVVTRHTGGTGSMVISEILVNAENTTSFGIIYFVSSLTTAGTVQFNWMAL